MPLLEVEGLQKHFFVSKEGKFRIGVNKLKAVAGIDFAIDRGETLGLVGESGCGKSTVARLLLRLIRPSGGKIKFNNENIFDYDRRELKKLRREMQIIFQNPSSSLNPRMTVDKIIGEPLVIHRSASRINRQKRVTELMEIVGLSKRYASRYPHEFSGGQQQRIGIARALALKPSLVVCDEPVSALDVSVKAQILKLLKDVQKEFGIAYLFISHDLSVVRYVSDRVSVMYLGKIIEQAGYEDLYSFPLHPYTRALFSAVPVADPVKEKSRKRIVLKGDMPSSIDPPSGCNFRTRCSIAKDICVSEGPELKEISSGHLVACHFADDGMFKLDERESTHSLPTTK